MIEYGKSLLWASATYLYCFIHSSLYFITTIPFFYTLVRFYFLYFNVITMKTKTEFLSYGNIYYNVLKKTCIAQPIWKKLIILIHP